MTTRTEIEQAIKIMKLAFSKIGQHKDGLPSGHLYAELINDLDLDSYNKMINLMKSMDLIQETQNLLTVKAT